LRPSASCAAARIAHFRDHGWFGRNHLHSAGQWKRCTLFDWRISHFLAGGWFCGFSAALSQVLSGQAHGFLIFWLGGWTLGGIFAAYYLYRVSRPAVPESLKLRANSVVYDSGVPAFQIQLSLANQKQAWASLFPKRTVVELERQQLESLRLRETDSGNRLRRLGVAMAPC